jgi:DNA topoisomerase-1
MSYNIYKDYLSIQSMLLIVESPSKCAKIEHFLGEDYCCIASKGHIRSIEGLKAIDTKKNFEPTFTFISEKEHHIENMRKTISMFSKSNIILASDDDREGEAIAWHICKIFDLPIETTKRIIFHEVTKITEGNRSVVLIFFRNSQITFKRNKLL